MKLAVWIVTGLALLSWSLLLWATHALLHLPTGWSQPTSDWLGQQPWAGLLERWWPGWHTVVALSLDLVQAATQWLTRFSTGLTWLLWALWAVGGLLLLGLAGLLHVALRAVQPPHAVPTAGPSSRPSPGPTAGPPSPGTA